MKRTILITGANGNLGHDVLDRLHREGHTILAPFAHHPFNDEQRMKIAHAAHVNLMHENETDVFVKKMTTDFPDLNAAVLLAGGFAMGGMNQTDEALLDKQISLNFKTAWFVIKPLLEHFKKSGGGQIVMVGARPAISPSEGKNMVAYSLSKSLLFSLAELINAEGKEHNVTASIIVPSTLDTAPNRQSMPNANFEHWVKTADVAEAISFLLGHTGSQLRHSIFKIYNRS